MVKLDDGVDAEPKTALAKYCLDQSEVGALPADPRSFAA